MTNSSRYIFLDNPRERKEWIVAIALTIVISVSLLFLPLFNYLGYEYSAAISFAIPWLCGFLTIGSLRSRFGSAAQIESRSLYRATGDSFARALSLMLVPFLASGINAAFVRNCDFTEGIAFYICIPVVTALFSVGLALCLFVLTRRPKFFFTAAILLMLIYPVYIGYTQPQIYSYNFIYGYFPGFSYDEVLPITGTMLLFRVLTLLAAVLFVILAIALSEKRFTSHPVRSAFLIILLITLAAAWFFRVDLGFESSTLKIRQRLSIMTVTEHFRIFSAPESFTADELRNVAAEHEFRYQQVTRSLQTFPVRQVTSYLYPDDEAKQELLGTATTNIAKPWLREIHLTADSWRTTLRHELVHVIAGEFGMPIIRANYRIGLVEGLAMSVDNQSGNRTLHEDAASLIRFGIVRHPGQLINPAGFASGYSSVSYVMMGSFCKYLRSRYGNIRFKEYYGGRPVDAVYGRTTDQLVNDWLSYLLRIPVPDSSRYHVEFYYKRQSIFAKECARTIARLNEQANRLLDLRRPAESKKEFEIALETSWNSESYAGLIRASFAKADYDTVVRLTKSAIRDTAGKSRVSGLLLLYGDALALTGQNHEADSVYAQVLRFHISDQYDEAAAIRIAAVREDLLLPLLRGYFRSAANDTVRGRWLDSAEHASANPLVSYLLGRRCLAERKFGQSVSLLDKFISPAGYPILGYWKEMMMGQSLFFLRQYQNAKIHFWLSENFTKNTASRNESDDWLERCDWYEKNGERYLKH